MIDEVSDRDVEGRDTAYMDVDRMVNEGLGGGKISDQNGLVGVTTTDTMEEGGGAAMDVNRAQTIIQAPEKVTVQYQGKDVWIDEVDMSTGTATVHAEANPDSRQVVGVEQLKEVRD